MSHPEQPGQNRPGQNLPGGAAQPPSAPGPVSNASPPEPPPARFPGFSSGPPPQGTSITGSKQRPSASDIDAWMPLIRGGWGLFVAFLLLVAWFSMAPEAAEEHSWQSDLRTANATAEANHARTEGAPQQQVVNGWHAVDLAGIQVEQLIAQYDQLGRIADSESRTGAMALLIGIGLAGELILRGWEGRGRTRGEPITT